MEIGKGFSLIVKLISWWRNISLSREKKNKGTEDFSIIEIEFVNDLLDSNFQIILKIKLKNHREKEMTVKSFELDFYKFNKYEKEGSFGYNKFLFRDTKEKKIAGLDEGNFAINCFNYISTNSSKGYRKTFLKIKSNYGEYDYYLTKEEIKELDSWAQMCLKLRYFKGQLVIYGNFGAN